jgi:hypothetical protein
MIRVLVRVAEMVIKLGRTRGEDECRSAVHLNSVRHCCEVIHTKGMERISRPPEVIYQLY